MARTVFCNLRNFSHQGSTDKSISAAPDVCKTPVGSSTPPRPYTVTSKAGDLVGGTSSVTVDGHSTAVEGATHSCCSGDEAGTAKGLGSGTVCDITEVGSTSPDVKLEGKGAWRNLDDGTVNGGNTCSFVQGCNTSPPQNREEEEEEVVEGVVLQHIVGIAGNRTRIPTGIIIAKFEGATEGQVITQPLSDASNLSSDQDCLSDHRQVLLSNLDACTQYQLFLKISEDYQVPLTFEASVRGKPEGTVVFGEWSADIDTWLVPMLPRTHSDHMLFTSEDSLQVLDSGFIYVFIEGRLWREIGIESQDDSEAYTLYEINLDLSFGLDEREDHIDLGDDTILIPHSVGRKFFSDIQITYSKVQWSWRQIQAYGGMHPSDPRVGDREQIPGERGESRRLRKKRMHKISNFLRWFQPKGKDKPHTT